MKGREEKRKANGRRKNESAFDTQLCPDDSWALSLKGWVEKPYTVTMTGVVIVQAVGVIGQKEISFFLSLSLSWLSNLFIDDGNNVNSQGDNYRNHMITHRRLRANDAI